jgi:hypothetical protein
MSKTTTTPQHRRTSVPVFVTELNGIMALIFYERSFAMAKSRAKAEMVVCGYYPRLEINGKAFWDGRPESIKTRHADAFETVLFFKSYAEAIEQDEGYCDGSMDGADMYSVFPAPVVINESRPIVWWAEAQRKAN